MGYVDFTIHADDDPKEAAEFGHESILPRRTGKAIDETTAGGQRDAPIPPPLLVQPFLEQDVCSSFLTSWAFQQFIAMTKIAMGLPTARNTLPFAKPARLKFARAKERTVAMKQKM
jgi:hypothetical protein